jgi:hypothetical protein
MYRHEADRHCVKCRDEDTVSWGNTEAKKRDIGNINLIRSNELKF